uniref:Glycosyl transferase family 9 n=1 Tax=Cyanothece sp. (strain PCC 7425 / ATCC 29141) TaxID=395961 RepID=B8HMI4_CYAP4
MRVVALVPGGIGDQILFFPTLEDLKRQYPQAEVDVVVEPRARAAYRVCPHVDRVLAFDFKGRNGPADWLNLLGVVRDGEYNIGLSLGSSWTVGFLLWLMGIPVRVSFTKGKKSTLLTNPVQLNPDQYAAALYHDLLKGLGVTTPAPDLKVSIPRSDLEWAEGERQRLGLDTAGAGYILIHGGSSQMARTKGIDKIYPVEKWQQVIQNIQARQPDLPIAIVQGPEDQEWAAAMLQSCPGIKVTSPDDIGKLAALIAAASLMLCTDSAPMHLGVAVKTYLVALFGPTDPAKLLPRDDRFIGIKSPTGQIADIAPEKILEKIWGG